MRICAKRTAACRLFVLMLLLLACPALAPGQGQEVHGGNSVFAGHGVAIAWGVLTGPMEEQTQVILRIVPAGERYAYVGMEGVDPFTHKRRVILEGSPLGEGLDVRTLRATFADLPRREIHFYRTADDWQARRPTLTVYYLGVPDTTPEFTSEAALFTYLAAALGKIQDAGRGRLH